MNIHRKEKKNLLCKRGVWGSWETVEGEGKEGRRVEKMYSAIKTTKNNNKFGHGDTQKTEAG